MRKRKDVAHIFITGASSGIGQALAKKLVQQGHQVSGVARRSDRLQEMASKMKGFTPLIADVTRADEVAAAAVEATQANGPVDTAILNAGIYAPQDGRSPDVGVFRQHVEVNYMGVVHGLAAIVPGMVARGRGRIMIVSSVAGWRGLPKSSAYGPTKAALISLAESLWFDLKPEGITVQVVCPGFVDTEATAINDFDMPDLQTPEAAAAAIIRGMETDQFEIAFPKRFARMMRLLRYLPYRTYFALVSKRTGRR